jgi:hypothetical protein
MAFPETVEGGGDRLANLRLAQAFRQGIDRHDRWRLVVSHPREQVCIEGSRLDFSVFQRELAVDRNGGPGREGSREEVATETHEGRLGCLVANENLEGLPPSVMEVLVPGDHRVNECLTRPGRLHQGAHPGPVLVASWLEGQEVPRRCVRRVAADDGHAGARSREGFPGSPAVRGGAPPRSDRNLTHQTDQEIDDDPSGDENRQKLNDKYEE